jgi:hypothetical protein
MCDMRFNGGSDKGKGVAMLLAAGFDHRQHRFHEAAAGRTLRPKRELSPDHRATQRCGRACGCCVLGGSEEFRGVLPLACRSNSSTRVSSLAIRSQSNPAKARTAGVISPV